MLGWHLVNMYLRQSRVSLLMLAFTTRKHMCMLLVEVITQTVKVSWKVVPQTAKVPCQERCGNGTASCCYTERIAPLSAAPLQGNSFRSKFLAGALPLSSNGDTSSVSVFAECEWLSPVSFHRSKVDICMGNSHVQCV